MRIIGHLDMDAFFAAIEERDNPRLAGLPIVVGSDPKGGMGRGVVSTANYAARAYGIRSALPISTAWRLSDAAERKGLPPAAFLDVHMQKYGEVSRRIMAILRTHAAHVQEASVDEAYFDLSFLADEISSDPYENARELARIIKKEIKEAEGLTASIGIGPNKLIAKIASDAEKPNGLTVVCEEDAENFIAPMGIRVIPGIGPKTEQKLNGLGVRLVRDVKKFSSEELRTLLGKFGPELYEKARGRSESPLVEDAEAKSIGAHETFLNDMPPGDTRASRKALEDALKSLAGDVHRRFEKQVAAGAAFTKFKSITLTVRFDDFVTKNRSVTLSLPSDSLATIQFQALRLFMPFLDRRENPDRKSFRLLGVRVEKLV